VWLESLLVLVWQVLGLGAALALLVLLLGSALDSR
jgi:hypothetical protein